MTKTQNLYNDLADRIIAVSQKAIDAGLEQATPDVMKCINRAEAGLIAFRMIIEAFNIPLIEHLTGELPADIQKQIDVIVDGINKDITKYEVEVTLQIATMGN